MKATLAATVFVALASCGGSSQGVMPTAQPSEGGEAMERIDCHVSYNPQRTGRSADLSVATQRIDEDRVRFNEMSVRIRYFDDGFESPAFNVITKSTGKKEDISARLYQFQRTSDEPRAPAKRPENEFVGGHGFTGLAYEFDPDSKAELQFWCEAF